MKRGQKISKVWLCWNQDKCSYFKRQQMSFPGCCSSCVFWHTMYFLPSSGSGIRIINIIKPILCWRAIVVPGQLWKIMFRWKLFDRYFIIELNQAVTVGFKLRHLTSWQQTGVSWSPVTNSHKGSSQRN